MSELQGAIIAAGVFVMVTLGLVNIEFLGRVDFGFALILSAGVYVLLGIHNVLIKRVSK